MEDKQEYTELGKCRAEISSDEDMHQSLPKVNPRTLQSHLSYSKLMGKAKALSFLQLCSTCVMKSSEGHFLISLDGIGITFADDPCE